MTDTIAPVTDSTSQEETRSSRRNLLRLAGAAAVGTAAAAVVSSTAEAANGDPIVIGNAVQSGTNPTALLGSSFQTLLTASGSFALAGGNLSSTATSMGVQGAASGGVGVQGLSASFTPKPIVDRTGVQGQGNAIGVEGFSEAGTGVKGSSINSAGVDASSDNYIDLRCYGTGRMWLDAHTAGGAPIAGGYFAGELIRDSLGSFWVCVQGNGSGAGTWRKIGGLTAAGSLHPLSAPARVYDSRKTMTPMANGILSTGNSRIISVADRRDVATGALAQAGVVPAGATAVTFNLTAVSTVGPSGFFSVNPGTDATVYSSHINWTANGLAIANAGMVGIDAGRQITVICGGAAASAHFIVDVTGYYL